MINWYGHIVLALKRSEGWVNDLGKVSTVYRRKGQPVVMKRKEPCGTVRIKGRSWYTSHHILPVVHLCALSVKQKRVVLASHSHTFDLKVILAKNQTFRQKGVIWARLIWLSVHSNPMNTNYINYIEFSCHLTIRFDSSILLFFSDSIVSCSFSHITLLFSSFFTEGRYKCFMMSHLIFAHLRII